jgi:glyoxylase-like metal-dependent hydrolase (beta-lactamase superfamily II)
MGLTVHPLELGSNVADSSFVVFGWNPGKTLRVASLSYLILGSDTPIMVDTSYRNAAELNASTGFEFAEPTREQTLERQLARYDLRPEDIGVLINTHLHCDHTGLADQLPNARIVVQRKELQYAAAPYFPLAAYDRVDIAKYIGPLYDQIEFVEERDGDREVAPGVTVAWTGGHSPGHQIVYAELSSGCAIITGDLVLRKDPGFDMQIPPGHVTDMGECMTALARIKRDARHVLPMHDPNVLVEYPDGVIN